jgi:hypothetical protein
LQIASLVKEKKYYIPKDFGTFENIFFSLVWKRVKNRAIVLNNIRFLSLHYKKEISSLFEFKFS